MNLKQKNTIPVIVIVVMMCGLGAFVTVRQLNNLKHGMVTFLIEDGRHMFMRNIDEVAEHAVETAALFSRYPDVINAFNLAHSGNMDDEYDSSVQRARELLRRNLTPFLEGFSSVKSGQKMKLHFHLPNGRSLVRMWQEKQIEHHGKWEDRSDDLSEFRDTVVEVNRSKKPVKGIEIGRCGIVVRGLTPVQDSGGRHLGSVEVMYDFEPLVENLLYENNYSFQLFMNKEFLGVAHRLQDVDTYPVVGERYVKVQGKSLAESVDAVDVALLDRGRRVLSLSFHENVVNAAFPIMDYSGQQIAVLLLSIDITDGNRNIRDIIFTQILILLLVVFLAGAVSLMLLKKTILNPVDEIINVSRYLSEGDLTRSIGGASRDEIGLLAEAMNFMIGQVRDIISKIVEVVSQLKVNIDAISRALEDQAAGTTQQSASVSEITSTMAEFSASSKEIAHHADTVLETAEQALNAADKGAESVALVTAKMEEINVDNQETVNGINALGIKTREITKIMEMIHSIADQTKLIAFNAALEASSAGEAGKRFGVVAVEIRRLAENVEISTSETEEKINEIQEAVSHMMIASEKKTECIKDGLSFSSSTTETLMQILRRSKDTRDVARQITLSTQQQRTASDQVVEALKEIDDSGRQTSRAIQQINENGKTLKRLAGQLRALTRGFSV